ncbi:MAG: 4-hydroxythreonine-4-phosphate dehydrogenase PdxA [Paracoccaceae bacterium]|nr:4-hydroxythreonine-4-phosphate dehydrogenase PdxA [Paracoccaceae bacterium]
MNDQNLPIAVLLGDPSGIGPELISRLLNDPVTEHSNIVIIGERKIFEAGEKIAGETTNINFINNLDEVLIKKQKKYFLDISGDQNTPYKLAECSASSGKSVIRALNYALKLANQGKISAINFAPFNKTSLHLAGNKHKDELHFIAEKLNVSDFFCEFNVVDNFWTARVTSHIALKDVPSFITKENILKPIKLIHQTMKLNGLKSPRIAVQALNPHAEFGTEEKDEIIPAIKEAQNLGINADGPLPCDTSFITAFKNKNYDCLVGMYHDALQCGLKAFGFDRGVTVQGGMPLPITTPAHGTAFDITGKNSANLEPTIQAFKIAAQIGARRQS